MIQPSKMPPPPSHQGNHPACNTPNPPWWCGEQQDVILDQYILILMSIALIIGIVCISIKKIIVYLNP